MKIRLPAMITSLGRRLAPAGGGRLRPILAWAAIGGLALLLMARFSLSPEVAAAETPGPEIPAAPAVVGKMILGLLAVLALIGMAAGALRLHGRARARGPLALISRLSLARGAQAVIVRVQGRDLLLGVTTQSVNLLEDLGEDTGLNEAASASPFAAALESMGGMGTPR